MAFFLQQWLYGSSVPVEPMCFSSQSKNSSNVFWGFVAGTIMGIHLFQGRTLKSICFYGTLFKIFKFHRNLKIFVVCKNAKRITWYCLEIIDVVESSYWYFCTWLCVGWSKRLGQNFLKGYVRRDVYAHHFQESDPGSLADLFFENGNTTATVAHCTWPPNTCAVACDVHPHLDWTNMNALVELFSFSFATAKMTLKHTGDWLNPLIFICS